MESSHISNKDISIDELMKFVKQGTDFPTAGIIYGYAGVKEAYHTGRGKNCTPLFKGLRLKPPPTGKERIIA